MRILHTADWHLGRQFEGHSLDRDHAAILDQMLAQAGCLHHRRRHFRPGRPAGKCRPAVQYLYGTARRRERLRNRGHSRQSRQRRSHRGDGDAGRPAPCSRTRAAEPIRISPHPPRRRGTRCDFGTSVRLRIRRTRVLRGSVDKKPCRRDARADR